MMAHLRPERPERPGLRAERLDLRPERTDFRPERTDFRPARADSRPERSDFTPVREDFSPERAWGDERNDGRTDEQKSPCVLQDFVPFRAAAQKGGREPWGPPSRPLPKRQIQGLRGHISGLR